MKKSVETGAGEKDFMGFSEEDLDDTNPDSAITKYNKRKVDSPDATVVTVKPTAENQGVLYLFNNRAEDISIQEVADSIKPDKDLVFVIAKWDSKTGWEMTQNEYYNGGSKHDLASENNGAKDVKIKSGEGNTDRPYYIEEDRAANGKLLSTRWSGEYVEFSGKIWRIVSTQNGITKLLSEDASELKVFDKKGIPVFYPDDEDNVGNYLNKTFKRYNRI